MKLKFALFFTFVLSFVSFSQTTETLKTSMQKLYEANFLMDFETITQLSYPKMVETIGKSTFLEKTELHYENEDYRLRYQLQSVPFQFGTITQIEKKSFCVITVRIPKRYFFETKLTPETANEKKTWLQEINNSKDVTFEPARNSFNVKMVATFVAVFDENTNGEWKFFNFDSYDQKAIFLTLFDESVAKQLRL